MIFNTKNTSWFINNYSAYTKEKHTGFRINSIDVNTFSVLMDITTLSNGILWISIGKFKFQFTTFSQFRFFFEKDYGYKFRFAWFELGFYWTDKLFF